MDLSVQNLYGLLLRSKLLSHEEARAMYARWHDEARDQSADPARFAAWMVQHRFLTEFQATLLARGHADGFFLNDYKILDRLGKGRMDYRGRAGELRPYFVPRRGLGVISSPPAERPVTTSDPSASRSSPPYACRTPTPRAPTPG